MLPQKDIGYKMKEAVKKCKIAFKELADALNSVNNQRDYKTSKYHK